MTQPAGSPARRRRRPAASRGRPRTSSRNELRRRLPRAPARAPRRHEQGRPAGPPDRQRHRARRGGRARPCSPCTVERASGSSSAATSSRATPRCGTRRRARRARSPASPTSRPFREIVQLDRHVLAGDFGSCREHLDIRFAACRHGLPRSAVSAESIDVRWWPVDALPEGTATTCGRSSGRSAPAPPLTARRLARSVTAYVVVCRQVARAVALTRR